MSPSVTFSTMNAVGLCKKFNNVYYFVKKDPNLSEDEIFVNYFNIKKPPNLFVFSINNKFSHSNHFYFKKVYKQIKDLSCNLNLVISRSTKALPLLAKIEQNLNIPSYYETHDFFANLSLRDDINIGKRKRHEKLENVFIPKISGIICLQNNQRKLYEKYFPNTKIVVARTGLFKNKYSNISQRKYLGYIGSLEHHKGVDGLIKAASESVAKPPLLIIGGKNDGEVKRVIKIASQFGYLDRLQITGWTDKKSMEIYVSQIRVGCIPLKDTFFNRYITSPLKLFDYFGHGIPIISVDLPTMRELIIENETGVFYEPDNVTQLTKRIDELFANEVKYKKMAKSVYRYADNLLWEKRGEKILAECVQK
jgi:glycosyltransferase involved in cell wall biosynthesis